MILLFYALIVSGLLSANALCQNNIQENKSFNHQSKAIAAQRFDSLFHILNAKRGFNGNVLIAQNGDVVYKNTFGYSDLKTKEPLNIESTFQIASVTKQFTATAIMMLKDEGKLSFSDTLQKFFPDFPYKKITVHQLLAHRSGLPEYMHFAGKYWKNKNRLLRNSDIMYMLIKYKPGLMFTPNKKYRYNNTGYVILSCIIEKVSEKPYHIFLQERIFNNLRMKNTFVYPPTEDYSAELTTKGHKKNKRKAVEDYLSGVVGDKGIYSTVEDMFKWDQALYTEQLVKQATLQEAFTPMSYDRKRKNGYGYGWRIDNLEDGSKIVYHAGWWRGYNSLFVRRLNDKTSVIILSNRVNWSFNNIDNLMSIIDSSKSISLSLDSN